VQTLLFPFVQNGNNSTSVFATHDRRNWLLSDETRKNIKMDRLGEPLTGSRYGMSEQIHIPSDWSVLVVEDTEDRISWFRQRMPKAVFAKKRSGGPPGFGTTGFQGNLP